RELAAVAGVILVLVGDYERGLPAVLSHEWPRDVLEEWRFENGESRNPPDYLPLIVRERLKNTPVSEREKVKAVAAPVIRTGKTAHEKKAAIQALQRAEAADSEALAPAFTDPDPGVRRLAVCEVISVQRPSSAIPLITEYLRRHPDESLAGWFEEWFRHL